MSPQLPQEIIDRIAFYLPYEKAVGLSKFMNEKLGHKINVNSYAQKGNLVANKWMHYHEKGKWQTRTMDCAAMAGQLDVVQWLHQNRSEGCTTDAMDNAARNGHLGIVKWLHENRPEGCTFRAMNNAARMGHLEVVQWLHLNRTEGCAEYAKAWASISGTTELIRWQHRNNTIRDAKGAAAGKRHLEVVEWLKENLQKEQNTTALASKKNTLNLKEPRIFQMRFLNKLS